MAHDAYTGASYPSGSPSGLCTSRLYELTHWLVTLVISLAWRSRLAMKCRATGESWSGSPES